MRTAADILDQLRDPARGMRERRPRPLGDDEGRPARSREEQPGAERQADTPIHVGRLGFEKSLRELAATQQLVAGHTTRMLSLIGAGAENDVLETGTRTIGAGGYLERHWQAPYAGIAVFNPGAATITVAEGGPGAALPGDGPGSFTVPPASIVVMPLVGRAATFYGTAGTRFSYCILARRPDPAGSLAIPAAGGAPAGSAPSGNPVLVAGSDGALVRTLATDSAGRLITAAGTQATPVILWNAVAVLAAGVSAGAAVYNMRQWFIFGNVNAATTLTVQVSVDFVAWRSMLTPAPLVLAGPGDFNIDCRALFGATYVRVLSSAAATITAQLVGSY